MRCSTENPDPSSEREEARKEAELLKHMPHGGILAREFFRMEAEIDLWKKSYCRVLKFLWFVSFGFLIMLSIFLFRA